jgi:hypothetical protein
VQTVNLRKLREAIGMALRDAMSASVIEKFCTGIGLAPPDPEQGDIAFTSKRAFVVRRLAGKELPDLLQVASQVLDECNGGDAADELARFVAQARGAGVAGNMKNLIFAADGPEPRFVLRDAINNDLEPIANEKHCLVYDRPLGSDALTLRQLGRWWADREQLTGAEEKAVWYSLLQLLVRSLDNDAERRIFDAYARRYPRLGSDIPVLLPQVYLHYDPYMQASYGPAATPLIRQRMDFLLLFPNRVRVVIECDGVQQNSTFCGAHRSAVSRNDAGSAYRREPVTKTSPERSPSRGPTNTASSQ